MAFKLADLIIGISTVGASATSTAIGGLGGSMYGASTAGTHLTGIFLSLSTSLRSVFSAAVGAATAKQLALARAAGASAEELKELKDALTSAAEASMASFASITAILGLAGQRFMQLTDDVTNLSAEMSAMGKNANEVIPAMQRLREEGMRMGLTYDQARRLMAQAAQVTDGSAASMENHRNVAIGLGRAMHNMEGGIRLAMAYGNETQQMDPERIRGWLRSVPALRVELDRAKKSGEDVRVTIERIAQRGFTTQINTLGTYGNMLISISNAANRLWDSLAKVFGPIAAGAVEMIASAMEGVATVVDRLADSFASLSPGTKTLLTIGAIAIGVQSALAVLPAILGAIAGAAALVGISFGPITLIAIAIAGAIYLIYENMDKVKSMAADLWDAIQPAWNAFFEWADSMFKWLADEWKAWFGSMGKGDEWKWWDDWLADLHTLPQTLAWAQNETAAGLSEILDQYRDPAHTAGSIGAPGGISGAAAARKAMQDAGMATGKDASDRTKQLIKDAEEAGRKMDLSRNAYLDKLRKARGALPGDPKFGGIGAPGYTSMGGGFEEAGNLWKRLESAVGGVKPVNEQQLEEAQAQRKAAEEANGILREIHKSMIQRQGRVEDPHIFGRGTIPGF